MSFLIVAIGIARDNAKNAVSINAMKNKTTAWTTDEDAALAAAIRAKISPARLTVRLQRSEAAIKRRLRELGLTGRRKTDGEQFLAPLIEPAILAKRFLDACKSGDVISLLDLYEASATLQCACTREAVYAGVEAIEEYWAPKIGSRNPNAFSLVSVRKSGGRILLDYLSYEGKPVRMYLTVDPSGKIIHSECGPRSCDLIAA